MQIYSSPTDLADILAEAKGYEDNGDYRRARERVADYNFRKDVNHYVKLQREAMSELQMRLQFGEKK